MTSLATQRIGDIVARDLRAAAVFEKYGIDYCCGGDSTVEQACRVHDIDPGGLTTELSNLERGVFHGPNAAKWPIPTLLDRIVGTHHVYIREHVPIIREMLAKAVARHGDRAPELVAVQDLFARASADLVAHLDKEEHVLFPYVTGLVHRAEAHASWTAPRFGTVKHPIHAMEDEHHQAAGDFARIRELTHHYTAPDDACATWRGCYVALDAFEKDLHQHVYLENHLLFPAAIQLECALAAATRQ